ncbi:putative primase zinc finger [Erysiphe neolycopersici]|uniref:Putative primase zinc finger n=1 Tax=Erysiphe neolycopersici TaxID=212602 RepID=A0A420HXM0_9PEZI|nr:putative primase zinc finger [Erysiphe neolycopersici]
MAKLLSENINSNWPPKSPHEVLLSTPSGRKRLRLLAESGSLSPSPSKRPKHLVFHGHSLDSEMNDDLDNDDEETLQLQLQEIQARLRLKKLQKRKKELNSNVEHLKSKSESDFSKGQPSVNSRNFSEGRIHDSNLQTLVDVPVSPILKRLPPVVPKSPSRVLLGIDKGLKGGDVSLRRVPALRSEKNIQTNEKKGFFLHNNGSIATNKAREGNLDRPKSFNERLAAVRHELKNNQLRQTHNKKCKSTAFDINQDQLLNLKSCAVEFTDCAGEAIEFNRDEILSSVTANREVLPRDKQTSDLQSLTGLKSCSVEMISNDTQRTSSGKLNNTFRSNAKQSSNKVEQEALQFEPYSSQHLLKRIIPHKSLTRSLSKKKIFLIPDLLREIKAPDFSTPDIEQDLVVLAIIASKSEPKTHRSNLDKQKRGKFMAFTLTDLKWELDFYLFDSAFEKFWKITPGTIIAILNPLILPPPREKIDTGKFSLMLNSDADTILEIGTARDLGFCKSVKRDGKTCNSWINKRHTEFCEYHVSARLNKTRASRMEVNTMTFGNGRFDSQNQRNKKNQSFSTKGSGKKMDSIFDKNTYYDQFNHSQVYIGQKRNTASLLDDVDFDPDGFHRGSTKEERMTRRMLSKEKERKLEKKLAEMGSGLGAEYARVKQMKCNNLSLIRSATTTASGNYNDNSFDTVSNDINTFEFLDRNGKKDVSLSPIKRKMIDTFSNTTLSRGWGKSLTEDLKRMRNGENLSKNNNNNNTSSPVRKKTRFLTEKGVREAGRESLGDTVIFDESDDDLDIIKD